MTEEQTTASQMMVVNSLLMDRIRLQNGGKTFEGERDLYKILGYTHNPTYHDFRKWNDRGNIAGRIVSAFPDASWGNPPVIIEGDDKDTETAFEVDFIKKMKDLKAWHYIHRLDKLAQIGKYAVMLVGIADSQEDLSQPAGKGDVVYLMPFSEANAEIATTVKDKGDPRYGKPEMYKLTTGVEEIGDGQETIDVHHSRTIHIAERNLDNDLIGCSILELVLNKLEDLEKIAGGGAESLWLNARGGLNLNADKDITIDNPEKLTKEVQEYLHQMTRMIKTKGIDVKPINHAIHSPKDHGALCLDLISGSVGIPKRILIGSEAAKLASDQDENNFDNRVSERQTNFCEPMILRPLLEIFKACGFMKVPEEFKVDWPSEDTLSDKDKADIADKLTKAIVSYANSPEADHIIPPKQFVEDVIGMDYQEDAIDELMKEEEAEMEEQRKQFAAEGLDEFGNPKKDPKPTE